jgi:hypothetical protein
MSKNKETRKKIKTHFPTKIALDYLKEKSKDLLDLSSDIFFDPDKLITEAGFRVKSPSITSIICKWADNLDKNTSFKNLNSKIYLTKKGRIKIIRDVIKEKNQLSEWDGKWRAVCFDIPELNKKDRRFLRSELKWMKFTELQHSIWITPFNIEKELLALLKLWKIDFRGDIRFLKIEKIVDDKDIKKHFRL